MRLIGWAIALAVAGITPAAAQTTASSPAQNAAAPNASGQKVAAPGAAQPAAGFAQNAVTPDAPTAPVSAQSAAAGPTTMATPPNSLGAYKETPAGTQAGAGMPIFGGKGIQEQVTPIGLEASQFHNDWLLPLCAIISLFVLVLLVIVLVRFRRGAHPVPSRNSHNTTIEVVWTLVPVLILVAIAIPSMRLLRHQYDPPKADVTVKVTGHQWYWTYELPDYGISFDSYMLKEANDPTRQKDQRPRTDADGPPLLAVDQRLVIPAGKVVKFIVTADDVIHSFAVPAFWLKQDANPGQLNETWAKVDRPGVYFGQCSELCGARHAFMPTAVEVVPPAQFAAWVASKGGKMPGAQPVAAALPTTGTAGPMSTPAPAVAGTVKAAPAPAPQNPNVANRATAND